LGKELGGEDDKKAVSGFAATTERIEFSTTATETKFTRKRASSAEAWV